MANQRTGIAFSPEDRKLIAEIKNALEKEHGKVSNAAAIRYALRYTVASLKSFERELAAHATEAWNAMEKARKQLSPAERRQLDKDVDAILTRAIGARRK